MPFEEDQSEEIEALESMFCEDGELKRLGEGWPIRVRIRFAPGAFLHFLFPPA